MSFVWTTNKTLKLILELSFLSCFLYVSNVSVGGASPKLHKQANISSLTRSTDFTSGQLTPDDSAPEFGSELGKHLKISARAELNRAVILHAQHDLAGAIWIYLAVASEFPQEIDAWDGMGIVLFHQVRLFLERICADLSRPYPWPSIPLRAGKCFAHHSLPLTWVRYKFR